MYKVISRSLLPADDSVDRLGCAAHGHGHAPPRTAPRRCGSSGDGVRSACCAIASSSSDPPAPDSFTNLHAAACAMLCGGQRAQHLMPSPSVPRVHTDDFAAPRNAPHTRCTWWPRSACLFCTSGIRHSSRRAVRHTHNITHCCLHRSVGARVPPPAFCPRARVCTLPHLRRRHGASRSQQSHARAVRRSLRHTHNTCPIVLQLSLPPPAAHTHIISSYTATPAACAHTGHPPAC